VHLKPLRALLALALLCPVVQASEPTRYSVAQLQQDFLAMQVAIARTHPDIGHSTDQAALAQAYRKVAVQLQRPMTRDEAWRVLATLNPVFADAHLTVNQPDWRGQLRKQVDQGGTLFPFEVVIDQEGEPRLRAELGGKPTALAGQRISLINGRDAREVVATLLGLAHGDTPAFRRNLLAKRWAYYYWKQYGEAETYVLTVADAAGKRQNLTLPGGKALPEQVQTDTDFERQFQFKLLSGNAALLTIKAFSWADKNRYFDFTKRAFAQMHDAGVETLLIDIRDNGGGDDDMWKQGLLRYIAERPYQNGSSYLKKVLTGRAGPGEQVGDVVQGSIQSWEQPEPSNPLHFAGKVYVLVGAGTYSSAILFSNAVQDYGFAQLAGSGGYARTQQSGGIQVTALPNTGLEVVAPRFILNRSSGKAEPKLVTPDIALPLDPMDEQGQVKALLIQLQGS